MSDQNYEHLLRQALQELRSLKKRVAAADATAREPIAIVGMGCRFPAGGDGPENFWDALMHGEDGIGEIPDKRWSLSRHFDPDPSTSGKMYTRRAALLDDIDGFDADFFSISPREAASLSPQQRLVMEVAWETLEHANILPEHYFRQAVGVYIGACGYGDGTWSPGVPVANEDLDAYRVTGGMLSAIAGRLSYWFGFTGPSLVVDTACSSSLVALHLACQALRQKECNMALAGGVNVLMSPAVTIGLCRTGGLAADGWCKTFDANADGFTRGEGCGLVALKRLSDAERDGDQIVALIHGSAINQDGPTGGLTVPSGPAQEALIRSALKNAALEPLDVDFIEAHGTGTPLGDPIEVQALAPLLEGRDQHQQLRIGSVKTNIGHLEGAAGIAGVIKTALALHHERIPANLHFNEPNPHIPWDDLALEVPTSTTPWPRGERPRIAGVSGFGFSGTNAHVIIGEAPAQPQPAPTETSIEPATYAALVMSAASPNALTALAARYAERVSTSTREEFANICHTAAVARTHFPYRLSITAKTCEEAALSLQRFARGEQSANISIGKLRPGTNPRTAFLFTGQGSQYPGMSRELYDEYPRFKATLDRCAEILQAQLEIPLLSVLFAQDEAANKLNDTAYTQPALFAVEYALTDLLGAWGVKPDLVIGHSVGEYVAACVAGVFSLEDGLRLIAERGRLMQALPRDGAMAAVSAAPDRVREFLRSNEADVDIAAINGPNDVTIAGRASVLNEICARIEDSGIRQRRLSVSHAFHSPLMDPILPQFRAAVDAIQFNEAKIAFVSNLSGTLQKSIADADHWVRHVRAPVNFYEGMLAADASLKSANDDPSDIIYVEIGPKPSLIGLARDYLAELDVDEKIRRSWVPSLRAGNDARGQLLSTVGAVHAHGGSVDWEALACDRQARPTQLPTYPFQRQSFPLRADVELSYLAPALNADNEALLVTDWQPQTLVAPEVTRDSRWLIAGADAGATKELAQTLTMLGVSTIAAHAGKGDSRKDADTVALDIEQIAEWTRLLDDVASTSCSKPIDTIIFVEAGNDPSSAPAAQCLRSVGGALSLFAALARRDGEQPPVWLVTTGAQARAEKFSLAALPGAGLWGLGRCVAVEAPALLGGLIDFENGSDPSLHAQRLCKEIAAPSTHEQIAYRDGIRHVARLDYAPSNDNTTRVTIRDEVTYFVSGGLGGLGLEIARWLVACGARHLLLLGRSRATDAAAKTLSALSEQGVDIQIANADVSDLDAMKVVFERLNDTGYPLGGVIHAAGAIDDASLGEQSASRLASVASAKIAGAWNLHELTVDRKLDFFVFFSSAAAVIGSPGQANYAASNAVMDALAAARRASGLPCVSINWGPWAEVGLAADPAIVKRLEKSGLHAIAPVEALDLLSSYLNPAVAQLAVIKADWPTYFATLASVPPLFERLATTVALTDTTKPAITTWKSLFEDTHPSEQLTQLAREIKHGVATAIGLSNDDPIDPDLGFFDLGFDSLMAVELKSYIEARAEMDLSTSIIFDYPTLNKLTHYIADRLDLGNATTDSGAAPDRESDALTELDGLSDDDLGALLDNELDELIGDGTLDND